MAAISPNAALFERALRVVHLMEAENARLKAERDLQRGDIALLRRRTEQLEHELATERSGRAELVGQVIDWLEQGEEIVRAGVGAVAREAPAREEPILPGQVARAAVRAEFEEALGRPRERMTTRDFARTFGGHENPENDQGLAGQS